MRWQGTAFRAHDPRWAWAPTSGAGAAVKGARFNPAGTPALYLSLTVEAMFLEAAHGFAHRFDPLTVCSYAVDTDGLADLTTPAARAAHHVTLEALACPWAYDRVKNTTPASWTVARTLIAAGITGILVPSFATGAHPDMTNLVLWRWGPALPHRVEVHDPARRLPRDGSSWSAPA